MKLACAAVLALGLPAWAQPPVVIKTETKLVMVDVVVTDKKGAYVPGLSAKDFRVWDDNKEQTIQSFTLESGGPAGAATQTGYLVLAFDYAGMDAGDQLRARQAGARFIDAIAGPNRRIAVASFDGGLRIAQSFTNNAGRLKDAVAGARSGTVATNNAQSGSGAAADLDTRDRFLALKTLASDLGAAPGRKIIVLFTGGLVARNNDKGALPEAIDAANRANVAIYPVDVRDVAPPSEQDASATPAGGRGRFMGGMLSPGARGGRGAVISLGGDSGPDTPGDDSAGANQDVLFQLAGGTGGFVIRNSSELPSGLEKVEKEQDEYYAIGFTPAESKEGACHALKVKTDRSGLTLRARSNYCTEKQETFSAGNATENDLAKRAAAAQPGNIAASLRLPFFYVEDGVARVYAAMEIDPDAIKFEKKNGRLHADVNVLGIAAASGGETAARFSDTLALDFSDADPSWKQKPVHYEKEFKIAPGQYEVTVVFSAGGESFGKITRTLTVEPRQPGQLAVSALALGKELRKDGADSAAPAASLFDDRTPLKINGVELVPTGSATFAKSAAQAYCYFEIYPVPGQGDAAGSLILQMRAVNTKTGETAWDGGAAKLSSPPGKTTIPLGVNVPLASFAPGAYRLDATVADGAGHSAQRSTDFEVK